MTASQHFTEAARKSLDMSGTAGGMHDKEEALDTLERAHNAAVCEVLEGLKGSKNFLTANNQRWISVKDIDAAIKTHGGGK